ncbi:leucine-rich repeat domain-containing protein [Treponema denticola]|uniref:leucine-rich repeat domain-containing protein n=1 Tax=Treponema denticola TaxID=158 RepID=UPI003D8CEF8A
MKNANTKSRASSVSKSRASSVSKLRARLLKSWVAVSVLAASLLFIGLLTGCPQKVNEKPQEASKYNYKVEHLQQNIADNDYTLYETETLSGKAGETTSAAAKPYAGFTAQPFSQAAIKTDGSTVVQIKYNRNIITIKLNLTGGTTTTPLTDGEGGIKLLKGKYGAKVELKNLKKTGHIFEKWTPELPSTFPASSPDTTYAASWTDKYRITVKGDERTSIPSSLIEIDLEPAKTWQNIQGDVANKVILKSKWQGGDYKVYEWRLNDENGTKLTDDYQIKSHITVYAVTNYAKFNIIDNKIKLTSDGKGYTGAAPKGKIIIHDGITEIEDGPVWSKGAFKNCTEISSVKFPQTLTKIGKNAFVDCTGLTSISLPANLTEIGDSAFFGCTGLTSITLPANLTQIDYSAFEGCTGLISLTIDSTNAKYKTEGNILYSKDGSTLIFAAGGLTYANIPDTVTTIGVCAFIDCTGLTSISLPTNLTEICNYAFYDCKGLTSITLPANLTQIGQAAFYGCKGLTSAVFADKNNWKVYDDEAHTQNETEINSSDLDNVATAAKYLRENTYHGGYSDKYWKKQ